MVWNQAAPKDHTRNRKEFESTLTELERERTVDVREVLNGNVQDRDGAAALLRRTRRLFPFIEVIYADGGYQGPKTAAVVAKICRRLHPPRHDPHHAAPLDPAKPWLVNLNSPKRL